MTEVRRISEREIRKSAGIGKKDDLPPVGLSPVLRAAWGFVRDMSKRFNRELVNDHEGEFKKRVISKF